MTRRTILSCQKKVETKISPDIVVTFQVTGRTPGVKLLCQTRAMETWNQDGRRDLNITRLVVVDFKRG